MRVQIILDPSNRRDTHMMDEAVTWLHYAPLRNRWTMTESAIEREADDDCQERVIRTFSFIDSLDAQDFCHWYGLQGRGRLA